MKWNNYNPINSEEGKSMEEVKVEDIKVIEIVAEEVNDIDDGEIASDFVENDDSRELTLKTIEWWGKFNLKFGKSYALPSIAFTVRGAVAGTATYQKQHINYNIDLYRNNKEGFWKRTIPHEIAHLFNYRLHVERREMCRWKLMPHGREWRQIMIIMGVDPNRCHSYTVEKVRKVSKDYVYKCSCREHKVSSILHNRMVKGKKFYKCNRCKGRITYIGKEGDKSTISMDKVEIEKKKKELEEMLAMLG